MNTGVLDGLVNGTEQVVFDHEITAEEGAQSSISTGNILNGDEDGWYTIIVRGISNYSGTLLYKFYFNSDTGTNYGRRGIVATATTVADGAATGETAVYSGATLVGTGRTTFAVHRVYAKSGSVRLINSCVVSDIDGTAVQGINPLGSVWSNDADNITSLTLLASQASGLGIGTRLIVIKSNNYTNGTPCGTITTPYIQGSWVRVGSQVLASAASSVTFSGLDGDTAVLYYLSYQAKNGYNGTNAYALRINADSGNNYGSQLLSAVSTTVAASRDVVANMGQSVAGLALNDYCIQSCLLFAKSGFIRPAIINIARGISTTTVTGLYTEGCSWNNTADNITSLVVSGLGGDFAAGSKFDLYALYK